MGRAERGTPARLQILGSLASLATTVVVLASRGPGRQAGVARRATARRDSWIGRGTKLRNGCGVTDERLNVLMVGPGLDVAGGISAVVNHWLAAGLDERVTLRYIATLDGRDADRPARKLGSCARAYASFAREALTRTVDIVHVHLSTGASFYRKLGILEAARLRRLKTVVHLHGSRFMEFYAHGSRRRVRLIRRVLDRADAVIVLSAAWRDFVHGISSNPNVHILHNGATKAMFGPRASNGEEIVISFMGRLGDRKGTWDLLEAFRRLAGEVPNVRLILGGDGETEKARRIVARDGLEGRVTVTGWLAGADKLDVFNRTDIYVLPSYHEGLPASIVEAMAAGAPIVSTPVGGIPEAVIDGHNGYLVAPGDIDALHDRLRRLVLDAGLRDRMGRRSRELMEKHFELDALLDRLVEVYRTTLRSDGRPRLKPAVPG